MKTHNKLQNKTNTYELHIVWNSKNFVQHEGINCFSILLGVPSKFLSFRVGVSNFSKLRKKSPAPPQDRYLLTTRNIPTNADKGNNYK